MKVICANPTFFSRAAFGKLAEYGFDTDAKTLTQSEFDAAAPRYDVVLARFGTTISDRVLGSQSNIKAIISPTTGLDHIDLEAARRKGVNVFHLRGQHEFLASIYATAEHTFGLMLAVSRRIPEANQSVRGGRWASHEFIGRELSGKRLGILGYGRLGRRVASYGRAFGMRVLAYDSNEAKSIEHAAEAEFVSDIRELFEKSDVLSIHVPGDAANARLVSWDLISRMPQGSMLINTSRGSVLDEEALVEALRDGRLSGAAVDVVSDENSPERFDQPLLKYSATASNLIATPHIAGLTMESMEKTDLFVIGRFLEWCRSQGLLERVAS